VLTQFGFAHGWRMAEAIRAEFNWSSDEDLRLAGPRLCALQGLFRVEPGSGDPLSKRGVMLLASYEAEQHLLHFGRSDEPVCWTVCGLTSGYISASSGQEIYVLEDRCLGSGRAACHLIGRTREDWGDEHAEELRFFDPLRLEECLDVSLQRVMETLKVAEQKLRAHRRALVRVTHDDDQPLGVVAKGSAMRQLVDLVRRVANVDTTVLITGETGSGKERIARLLHEESTRAAGPFVAVNCGAIVETLLESELFGHTRGAFSGATQDRPGLFEAANGGTLLLDEIIEMAPELQVKLLRVLNNGEYQPLGSTKTLRTDARIIASTNADPNRAVREARLREDLYFRINVVTVELPALRERREDIPLLAEHFVTKFVAKTGKPIRGVSGRAMAVLCRYPFPGNVRELENAIEHAFVMCEGDRIEPQHLPAQIREITSAGLGAEGGEANERHLIDCALRQHGGNRTHAARELGIHRTTLWRKMKVFGFQA
jgi:two-component system, NtrC family, response regulator HydG